MPLDLEAQIKAETTGWYGTETRSGWKRILEVVMVSHEGPTTLRTTHMLFRWNSSLFRCRGC